ncbi:GntR family transcriptional regulator [Plantactinospora sp. B6F1]|uniref:GntR family transcriptional regulator n=1 Tax=Plantactinospora sp. B6F1 TaxID=3158971 RepID=UPI0032D8FFC1
MPYAQPLWRQIRDDLRAKIRAGIYPPGSKLPSTRELADEYETSHVTVRRAVDSMIERDELVGRTGIGVFVVGDDQPPS